jgi:hypothetical protein
MSANLGILRQAPRAALPASVQLALRVANHPATGVLDYLARCERAAALRNRRDLVDHYQQCWNLVHDGVYGLLPLPMLRPPYPTQCPPPMPKPLKGWEKQKYSKPLRRVTRRRDVAVKDGHGVTIGHLTVLELECGHEWESAVVLEADENPKWRRCRSCANSGYAASVEVGRRKPVAN